MITPVAAMPNDMRSGWIIVPPPMYLPLARWRSASLRVRGDMTESASTVMRMSPVAARAPAFRITARFLPAASIVRAPCASAISAVRSLQRLRTTMVSTRPGYGAAARRMASRHAPIQRSSSRAGTTIENLGALSDRFIGCVRIVLDTESRFDCPHDRVVQFLVVHFDRRVADLERMDVVGEHQFTRHAPEDAIDGELCRDLRQRLAACLVDDEVEQRLQFVPGDADGKTRHAARSGRLHRKRESRRRRFDGG